MYSRKAIRGKAHGMCPDCGASTHSACISVDKFGPGLDLRPYVGQEIVIGGALNGANDGRYKVTSRRAGKTANFAYGMGAMVPSPPPSASLHTEDLAAAKLLQRNPSVRLHSQTRGRRRRVIPFRVLDHGDNWREQNCPIRYSVVRWPGTTPPEWSKVGWHLGNQLYDHRKPARTDADLLNSVADVMEC